MGDSNFLFSEYDSRDDRVAYEANWWEGDHSCIGSGRVTGLRETQAVVKWQETAEYSEQRRPNWGCCREDRS